MRFEKPRLMIAALRGGAGKTFVSLGLAAAWRKYLGLRVSPFKKGPDYIDAGWLSMAAGSPCCNLDPFLMKQNDILNSFVKHSRDADICLIEGNRGVFDGVDVEGACSSANLAKVLGVPVVLVLDATKTTRTAAAMVLGCRQMDPDLNIGGIVLNRVAGSRHESILRGSIAKYCDVPVLGVIPKLRKADFPERHMGLIPPQEHAAYGEAVEEAAAGIRDYLDLEALRRVADEALPLEHGFTGTVSGSRPGGEAGAVTIGVVRDSAFQFYYPENLEALVENGASLVEISSLDNKPLPPVDALYIGGGFPETHAEVLGANEVFRESLLRAIEDGLPVYAECGGFMLLCRTLRYGSRVTPMTGVFPFDVVVEQKPQGHGYSVMECVEENPYYAKGATIRGHEFHYSRIVTDEHAPVKFIFRLHKGHGIIAGWDGVTYKNVLAGYSHIHSVGNADWAGSMVRAALLFKADKPGKIGALTRECGGLAQI